MKRKTARKKPTPAQGAKNGHFDSNGAPREEPLPDRVRKYLDSKFAERLLQHMHAAKRAALGATE